MSDADRLAHLLGTMGDDFARGLRLHRDPASDAALVWDARDELRRQAARIAELETALGRVRRAAKSGDVMDLYEAAKAAVALDGAGVVGDPSAMSESKPRVYRCHDDECATMMLVPAEAVEIECQGCGRVYTRAQLNEPYVPEGAGEGGEHG